MTFLYFVTSNVVSLDVGVFYDDLSTVDGLLTVATFGIDTESPVGQETASGQSWSAGFVRLPKQDGSYPSRIAFVANKNIATADSQIVAIDSVTITANCLSK